MRAAGSAQSETFKVMERRLLRGIMNPAMIGDLDLRHLLLAWPGIVDWGAGWIHAKLALVMLHAADSIACCARWRRHFAADRNSRPARFYRIVNEVPTAADDRHRHPGRGAAV